MSNIPDTWRPDNNGIVGLLGTCYTCHTPADEWPDTLNYWVIQMVAIEDITDPDNQQLIRCSSERECQGHPIERHLFCIECQKEGKHDVDASHKHNRPKS